MKDPKYKLWDLVGFKDEMWQVCGYSLKFGYQSNEWNYFLKEPEEKGEYTKTVDSVPEIYLKTPESILQAKIQKAENEAKYLQELANKAKIDLKELKRDKSQTKKEKI